MAIGTPTALLSGSSGSSLTSYNTASSSPSGNSSLILFISAGITGVAAAPSGVTGFGLTWTKRTDMATNNGNLNGSIWTAATTTAPSSAQINITFASAPTNVGWKLIQVTGSTPSTSNFDAITSSLTTPSDTLPSSPASTSGVITFINYNASTANTMTPGAQFTKIGTDLDAAGSPANQVSAAYDITSPTTTYNWTTTNGSNKTIHGIVVNEASNSAPTANAGPDQSVQPFDTVTLTGAASTDSDGTISSYSWSQTAGSTVTLSGSGATRTFSAPALISAQTLTFSLTVTDNGGLTSTADTVNIDVAAHDRFRIAADGTTRRAIKRSRVG